MSIDYPFVPKSTRWIESGQYWSIPLSDGRFACGRVLGLPSKKGGGSRTSFVAGLLNWVGTDPPTDQSIAGSELLESGHAHIKSIAAVDGQILGVRSLELDGLTCPTGVSSHYGGQFMRSRAEHIFVEGSPPPPHEFRDVKSPLTDQMLRPFDSPSGLIQFSRRLTDQDFQHLARFLEQSPNIGLRAYGSYDRQITDVDFLKFFPNLTDFSVNSIHDLKSLEGLRHLLPTLKSLAIGDTRHKLDLGVLTRFDQLQSLHLEGQTKNIGVISELTTLEELTLRSVTLPDLSILLPLKQLRSLSLKLGGTQDLGLLPRIGHLEHLEIWMIKGLTDITSVSQLPHLRYLFLQALRRVDTLPDLADARQLKRLHLETMKGLHDLTPIAAAPAIESLIILDMPHLSAEHFQCLVDHPTLSAAAIQLGRVKTDAAVNDLLNLPDTKRLKVGWRTV